jgi:hypothetical protein
VYPTGLEQMPDGNEHISVKVAERIAAIGTADWDIGSGADDPF